jgi:hypothetical protein
MPKVSKQFSKQRERERSEKKTIRRTKPEIVTSIFHRI